MLEVIEVIKRSNLGMTRPFLCLASDNQLYYVKGRAATYRGLFCEWVGAHLARDFGLNIPPFSLVYISDDLIDSYGTEVKNELGAGIAFASLFIDNTIQLTYEHIAHIPLEAQYAVLLFDYWVRNEDRTLTKHGGNPNILWHNKELLVIDHNLIFDNNFNDDLFKSTHVFAQGVLGQKIVIPNKSDYEYLMRRSCLALYSNLNKVDFIPNEWLDYINLSKVINLDQLLQDASGEVWQRLEKCM